MTSFASEGFDLSTLGDASDAVLEEDGSVTTSATTTTKTETVQMAAQALGSGGGGDVDEADKAIHVLRKEEGNALFLKGDYASALDCYHDAIVEAERECLGDGSDDGANKKKGGGDDDEAEGEAALARLVVPSKLRNFNDIFTGTLKYLRISSANEKIHVSLTPGQHCNYLPK